VQRGQGGAVASERDDEVARRDLGTILAARLERRELGAVAGRPRLERRGRAAHVAGGVDDQPDAAQRSLHAVTVSQGLFR